MFRRGKKLPSENSGDIPTVISRLTRGFLVLLFFASYLILYLFTADLALRKIPGLSNLSERFIPAYQNFIPGFSYVGFVVPLTVALIVLLLLISRNSRPTLRDLEFAVSRNRFWLIAAALSVIGWYFMPGFASGGHTDFLFAILICICVGWHINDIRPKQSIFVSFVLGFGIGFVSDLQSQTFFTGIFGGWGLLDGDLVGTILLPLATLSTLMVCNKLTRKDVSVSVAQKSLSEQNTPILRSQSFKEI